MAAALTRRSVSVPHGIGKIPAYLVRPRAPGTYPGVVVIMEWWGLVPHIKDVADRFAAEGFAAIAPDLYHGKVAETPEEAAAYYGAMSMEGAVRECISCSDYLKAQPYSNGKSSMVGYCLGGTVCYLAPCRGAGVDATVAFLWERARPRGAAQARGMPDLRHLRRRRPHHQRGARAAGQRRAQRVGARPPSQGVPRVGPRLLQRHEAELQRPGGGRRLAQDAHVSPRASGVAVRAPRRPT